MTVTEAVGLTLQSVILSLHEHREYSCLTYVLNMGETVKVLDLAYKMIAFEKLKIDQDISIQITGMGKAEKITEELFHDSNKKIRSSFSEIVAEMLNPYDLETIKKYIEAIKEHALQNNREKLLLKIEEDIN